MLLPQPGTQDVTPRQEKAQLAGWWQVAQQGLRGTAVPISPFWGLQCLVSGRLFGHLLHHHSESQAQHLDLAFLEKLPRFVSLSQPSI